MILQLNLDTDEKKLFTPGVAREKTLDKAVDNLMPLMGENTTTKLERIEEALTTSEVVQEGKFLPTDTPDIAYKVRNSFSAPLEEMTVEELVTNLQDIESSLQNLNRSKLEQSIVSGTLLIQLKQSAKEHSNEKWEEYLNNNLPGIPYRTATRRMRLADPKNWQILEKGLEKNPNLGVVEAIKLLTEIKPAKPRGKSPTPEAERRKAIKCFFENVDDSLLGDVEALVNSFKQYLLDLS